MTQEEAKATVAEIASRRSTVAELKGKLNAARDEFNAQHAELIASIKEEESALSNVESQIRAAAAAAYQETGNKKPFDGIGVRVGTDFIYDGEQAFAWAKEKGICLTLNEKEFKAICKTPVRPDFVQEIESISATIASDLSAFAAA